ncbi:MAG: hypothetical protein OHK0035_31230 [Cyanobacteria bacterium J069]
MVNDGEAQNFGIDSHLEHDQRYDRADEFLEVAHKLWASWQRSNAAARSHSGAKQLLLVVGCGHLTVGD